MKHNFKTVALFIKLPPSHRNANTFAGGHLEVILTIVSNISYAR